MKRTKPIPKRRSKARRGPLRAPGYLDWLRKNYCLLCQHMGLCQFNETEAAHTGPHGTSQKAADNQALPLCGRCHREARYSLHVLGRAFWNNFHLDREALVEDYWRRWVNTVASEKELAALRERWLDVTVEMRWEEMQAAKLKEAAAGFVAALREEMA